MKTFNVPVTYRSPLISAVKSRRRQEDKMKKDFRPTLLDFGPLQIYLARHFGFCYGVENAIEIAFRTVEENPGKKIYLLSEMIHNPQVNADLVAKGVRFLQDTLGNPLMDPGELSADDIVLIPAFGTTLDMESRLRARGIAVEKYDTTCPFVEKVWNRSEQIARNGYSIVIHGKPRHEETRATFSHAAAQAPSVIIKDMEEARLLARYIRSELPARQFYADFAGRHSEGFECRRDLQRIGVVNQTTQLASDTQAIADFLRSIMTDHFGLAETGVSERFADTRDTLCYATSDNQTAVASMLDTTADLAVIVGGYNSSNTTHLVEISEQKLPTYFINNEGNLPERGIIRHFDIHQHMEIISRDYLPSVQPVRVLVSSGASCPDSIVESVIRRLAGFFQVEDKVKEIEKRMRV